MCHFPQCRSQVALIAFIYYGHSLTHSVFSVHHPDVIIEQKPPSVEECKQVMKDALGRDDHDRSWAFKEIYDTNEWSSTESKSGKGSTMRYTGEFSSSLAFYQAIFHARIVEAG